MKIKIGAPVKSPAAEPGAAQPRSGKAADKAAERRAKTVRTPWLSSKEYYRDTFRTLAEGKMWAVITALAAVMGMLACAAMMTYSGAHAKYIPYVVAVNEHGMAIASGLARETNKADERVIVSTLSQFVEYARSITVDLKQLRRNIYWCYAHTLDGDPSNLKLSEWFSGQGEGNKDPFAKASEGLIQVDVKSAVAQTPTTWQVDWVETYRARDGKRMSPDVRMRAIITWSYGAVPQDIQNVTFNPLGIYIKDFNWTVVK